MIESGLYQYLVSALTGVGGRVYPGPLPSKPQLPAVTFSRSETEDSLTFDEGQTDFVGAHFHIDCWGADFDAATSLYADLHAALKNFRGYLGGAFVHGVFRQAMGDFFEYDVPGYRRSATYLIWHRE